MSVYDPIQIVATLGPATTNEAVLEAMLRAGVQLARLNFSWGTHDEHRRFVQSTRLAASRLGRRVAIMQDLSGPRVQQGAGHTYQPDQPVVTKKDTADIAAMADLEIEYVALSFVRGAHDIADVRSVLAAHGSAAKVIAKIERVEAIDNLDEILAVVDGIMVARGDLGAAVPVETLPFLKKHILQRCKQANVPSIVATEMLTSMTDDPVPSRADISDIAHAVLDGASATMLSNETAIGANPVETVAMMRRVVNEALSHTKNGSLVRFRV